MTVVKSKPTQPLPAPICEEDTCVSCGSFAIEVHQNEEPLCSECRAPLRFLSFPDEYCDLGGSD